MSTLDTAHLGRSALTLAGVVGLMLVFAFSGALAAEPDELDPPLEPIGDQALVRTLAQRADVVESTIASIPVAEAIELHRRAELGMFFAPNVLGVDPDVVAKGIEIHGMAEYESRQRPSVRLAPAWVPQAIELHRQAEGYR